MNVTSDMLAEFGGFWGMVSAFIELAFWILVQSAIVISTFGLICVTIYMVVKYATSLYNAWEEPRAKSIHAPGNTITEPPTQPITDYEKDLDRRLKDFLKVQINHHQEISRDLWEINTRLGGITSRLDSVTSRLDTVDYKISNNSKTSNVTSDRISAMNTRFDTMHTAFNTRFDTINAKLNSIKHQT